MGRTRRASSGLGNNNQGAPIWRKITDHPFDARNDDLHILFFIIRCLGNLLAQSRNLCLDGNLYVSNIIAHVKIAQTLILYDSTDAYKLARVVLTPCWARRLPPTCEGRQTRLALGEIASGFTLRRKSRRGDANAPRSPFPALH